MNDTCDGNYVQINLLPVHSLLSNLSTHCRMLKKLLLSAVFVSTVTAIAMGQAGVTKTIRSPRTEIHKITFKNETQRVDGFESEMVNIIVRFTHDESMIPVSVTYGSQYGGQSFDYEGDEMEICIETVEQLPPILIAEFAPVERNNNSRWFVFKKVDTFTDGMEIEFDAKESKNAYTAQFLRPDGKPFDQYDSPETADDYQIFGTVAFVYAKDGKIGVLGDKDYIGLVDPQFQEEKVTFDYPTLYSNTLPEGAIFCADLVGSSIYQAAFYALQSESIVEPGVAQNDPDLYVNDEYGIMPSKGFYNSGYGMRIYPSIHLMLDGWEAWAISLGGTRTSMLTENGVYKQTYYCIPNATMTVTDFAQALGQVCAEGELDSGEKCSENTWYFNVVDGTLKFQPFNMSIKGTTAGCDDIFCRTYDNWMMPDYRKMVNPHIIPDRDRYVGVAGNNVASLVFAAQSGEGELPEEYFPQMFDNGMFNFGFVGRNGIYQESDKILAVVSGEQKGDVYTYTIESNNTLIYPDIDGRSVTTLECNMKEYDFAPPTLQLLQFTNEDGYVVDQFENTEGAKFNFYAGDFFWEISEDFTKDRMNVRPMKTVKVEYAAHGSDVFNEIEVTENPEKFYMPGYGYWFDGSLSNIIAADADGWCDMRFTLTDQSGNVMTQILSPAFRINCLAGIERLDNSQGKFIVTDSSIIADGAISVFDIRGLNVASGDGAVDIVGLTPGFYVVHSNTGVYKFLKK